MSRTTMQHQRSAITALALLLCAPFASAQTLKTRMADRYMASFDYPRAAEVYEDMVATGKADVAEYRSLARAYEQMGQTLKAEAAYASLVKIGTPSAVDMRHYGDLLRANGKYQDALTWYGQAALIEKDDPRAKGYVERPDLVTRLMRDSTANSVRKLNINSPEADLGPAVMNDLLLFSSARGAGVGGRNSYNWDHQPFLNLYSALLKGQNASDPLVMRKDLNSRYHDGTCSYDSALSRLYFTRDNWYYGRVTTASDGELKLGIYYSEIQEGEFGQREWGPLVFWSKGDPGSNFGHPFISPDGKRLWFISDAPGGFGGADIWYSDLLSRNKDTKEENWSNPVNMGPRVNTPGDEMYPFITRDSMFYFTSDGHPGMGGQDIFWCKLSKAGASNVYNLGYPLNTRANDHGLILLRDDSTGFFTSDRPGGMGSDDIYGCTVRRPKIRLAGIVLDKVTRTPIEGSTIVLKNDRGEFIDDFKLEQQDGGKFTIETPYNDSFTILTSKNGYRQQTTVVNMATDPAENIVVEMEKYDYGAEGVVYNGETMQPLPGAKVQLCDANDAVLEEQTVGDDGHYQFSLQPEKDYRLKVEKEGFFKQSARISTKGKTSAIIHTDFKLFPLEVGQVVRLENIYYDYNKWNIRPDAAIELDKLVQTLLDNPTVKIELSSHTDCRGTDSYNLSLSEKRAKSAVEYMIKHGIDKAGEESKGYGETKPSEACDCKKSSDHQHQRNRRTEFKVLEQ